ncbi:hypothetical protein ACFVJH_14475 [Streptomyces decoyicus]
MSRFRRGTLALLLAATLPLPLADHRHRVRGTRTALKAPRSGGTRQ